MHRAWGCPTCSLCLRSPCHKGRTCGPSVERLVQNCPCCHDFASAFSTHWPFPKVLSHGVRADSLYEEVEPKSILDVRKNEDGTRDFLVQWADGAEDSWVAESYLAEDVIEDYEQGLEYAEAECIVEMKRKGDARQYLVR